MSEIPECPEVDCPSCVTDCACGPTERALRAWGCNRIPAMTTEQRLWCFREIDSVEGWKAADYDGCTDDMLARAVLCAWVDYCRDKGLL